MTLDNPIARDGDRHITGEGPWTITRDSTTAEVTSIADSSSTLSEGHNEFGALDSRTLKYGSTERYKLEVDHDDVGRISERRETVNGTLHTFTYGYDDDGRLTDVDRDGSDFESYAYDDNGNRTSNGATYDVQDRLQVLGGTTHTFDDDGFLATRGSETFSYGRLGELLSAQKTAGYDVTYAYDAMGRLVSATPARTRPSSCTARPGSRSA